MAEKKDTITYTFIEFTPFPDFSGTRTMTRVKVDSPGYYKPELHMPVPESTEQAQKMYGLTLRQLIGKGVRQQVYDVSEEVKVHFESAMKNEGVDLDQVSKDIPVGLFVKPERKRKVSEAKKAKETLDEAGIRSVEELKAKLARLEELERLTSKKKK